MSERSVFQRYARDAQAAGANAFSQEAEFSDDFGAFGWLRGVRERAIMLELRKKNGTVLAVGYAWLEKAEFDPSEGITLSVCGERIRVRGRNLNSEVRPLVRLFEGLVRHRVPWIREAEGSESMQADERATLIDRIEW